MPDLPNNTDAAKQILAQADQDQLDSIAVVRVATAEYQDFIKKQDELDKELRAMFGMTKPTGDIKAQSASTAQG